MPILVTKSYFQGGWTYLSPPSHNYLALDSSCTADPNTRLGRLQDWDIRRCEMEERARMTTSTKEQLRNVLGAMLSDLGRVAKNTF